MTKKRVLPVKKYETASFPVQDILLESRAACMPTNLSEEKEKFFRSGKAPEFHLKDRAKVQELALKAKNHIRFDLLGEAQFILEKVRERYGDGEYFLEHAFGPRITKEEATPTLLKYISENNLPESIKINWCNNMTCSAKMVWSGPNMNINRPDLRKFSLWVSGSEENAYLRESGIQCLMDHEIGTHFYRSFNDGFQPWYSERERFGLRKLGSVEALCTEEGLAAIHTVLRGRISFLWVAAMGYYIACKSAEMTFKELFDHLGRYTSNQDYRWKQAMRVKRGLSDPNDLGGFGNDQCYFEGAVNILRRLEEIDFQLLMMGKVCYDELDRIKRVVRKDVVQYPTFMKNVKAYRRSLRKILVLNGLDGEHLKHGPPHIYLKQLEERRKGKNSKKKKKVRSRLIAIHTANAKLPNTSSHVDRNMIKKEEEVKTFSCSNAFRFLSKPEPRSEMERVLKHEPEGLKNVRELTNSLYVKDSILNKQIERLNSIVKNHKWITRDEECRKELKDKTIESEDTSSSEATVCNDVQLPQISKTFLAFHEESENVNARIGNADYFELKDNPTTPDIVTYELCSGTACDSGNVLHSEPICYPEDEANDIHASSCQSFTHIGKTKGTNNSKNSVFDLSNKSDQVLHPPVTIACNIENNMTANMTVLQRPLIQKRFTSKNIKSESHENAKDVNERDSCSSATSSSSDQSSEISRENVRQFDINKNNIHEPRLRRLHQQKRNHLSKIPNDRLHDKCNLASVRKVKDQRPMSTDSEGILRLHWVNIANSMNSAEFAKRPMRSSLSSISDLKNTPLNKSSSINNIVKMNKALDV